MHVSCTLGCTCSCLIIKYLLVCLSNIQGTHNHTYTKHACHTSHLLCIHFLIPPVVTVTVRHGFPVVSLPLPSRRETCDFTLRPYIQSVGDFVSHIKSEDLGVERCVCVCVCEEGGCGGVGGWVGGWVSVCCRCTRMWVGAVGQFLLQLMCTCVHVCLCVFADEKKHSCIWFGADRIDSLHCTHPLFHLTRVHACVHYTAFFVFLSKALFTPHQTGLANTSLGSAKSRDNNCLTRHI